MSSQSSSRPDANRRVEETFVETFISPNKRERYKSMLANPTRRPKFLNRLNHNLDFIPDLAQRIPANDHNPAGITKILNQMGVRDTDAVYLISDTAILDGLTLGMRLALEQAFEFDSCTVLCCSPQRVAYYKPESPEGGYILKLSM